MLLKSNLYVQQLNTAKDHSEAGLLTISSHKSAAFCIIKFLILLAMSGSHFDVLLKSSLYVQQLNTAKYHSEACLLTISSNIAAAFGITKFLSLFAMNWVTI